MTLHTNDLIPAGRLSSHAEDGDWLRFHPDPGTEPDDLPDDVFLFFAQHKVWYVTIAERSIRQGKRLLRFAEPEVLSEVRSHGRVNLMTAPDDDVADDAPLPGLEGMAVWFEGRPAGTVTDWFHNGAHWVLVCEDPAETEFMIPFVDAFIESSDDGRIVLRDAGDLIPECASTS